MIDSQNSVTIVTDGTINKPLCDIEFTFLRVKEHNSACVKQIKQ